MKVKELIETLKKLPLAEIPQVEMSIGETDSYGEEGRDWFVTDGTWKDVFAQKKIEKWNDKEVLEFMFQADYTLFIKVKEDDKKN